MRIIMIASIIAGLFSNIFGQKIKTTVQHVEWSKNATIYEVNVRQYTPEGTFAAFEKHLPRLKKLGVKILWLMPIHPIGEKNRKGSLGSYYAVKDYLGVNPEYGTEEDFRHLVNKIHDMGMYVIIDWVANHTAWDNVWVKEHPEFYNRDENGNFYPPVKGWQDVIDLNYDNKDLWSAMTNALEYWVKEFDIDGYRCDVAAMVPTEFWNQAREKLDSIKPVFMLAEATEPELQEKAFDMTYNWQLKDLMNDIAAGKKNAKHLLRYLRKERRDYPADAYRMNFTTNHDENSWNGTVFERLGDGVKCFAVLSNMLPGMPLIYSGQEAGLNKRLRFFDKDTIDWSNLRYFDLYEKLFHLHLNNKALWNGSSAGQVKIIRSALSKNTFAFFREKDDDTVVALFNLSGENQKVSIEDDRLKGKFNELFTGVKTDLSGNAVFNLTPWEYRVFVKERM